MGLRHIIPVVVLTIQLGFGLAVNLHPLRGNRLSEGEDRNLPNASPISCGTSQINPGTVKRTRTLDQALGSYFSTYAFTAGPISSHQSPRIHNGEARFKFAEVKGSKYVYALEVDPTGESAYWLNQGGSIDVPAHPNGHDPKYVFTPDFSGCSWTVTPMRNGNLRLRHVEGSYEAEQFNNLSEHDKGGSTTYAMEYKDYAYVVERRRLVGNIPAFAYMHYSGGRWTLYFQRKSCSSTLGGFVFRNNKLSSASMMETPRSSYPAVSGTKAYTIP